MTKTNRHPADEIGDVRAQIAVLKKREDELRDMLLADGASLLGDEFVADISTATRVSLDGPAVRKALGDERLAKWLKSATSRTLRVKPRVEEAGDEE